MCVYEPLLNFYESLLSVFVGPIYFPFEYNIFIHLYRLLKSRLTSLQNTINLNLLRGHEFHVHINRSDKHR